MDRRIMVEVYALLESLGAPPAALAIIGSYGDTLSDAEVLSMLQSYNDGEPYGDGVICEWEEPDGP